MTNENLVGINQLYSKYADSGLVILAFPCSQFFNQAPGTVDEFIATMKYVRPGNNYAVSTPYLMNKIQVNGAQEDPVYTYLKQQCPFIPTQQIIDDVLYLMWTPLKSYDITWNFAKFLIDRKGVPYARYHPTVTPAMVENDIAMLLAQ
jgi:glutathione peroxidase